MFAIISDIHSNLEALTTVLGDIERRGICTEAFDRILGAQAVSDLTRDLALLESPSEGQYVVFIVFHKQDSQRPSRGRSLVGVGGSSSRMHSLPPARRIATERRRLPFPGDASG